MKPYEVTWTGPARHVQVKMRQASLDLERGKSRTVTLSDANVYLLKQTEGVRVAPAKEAPFVSAAQKLRGRTVAAALRPEEAQDSDPAADPEKGQKAEASREEKKKNRRR